MGEETTERRRQPRARKKKREQRTEKRSGTEVEDRMYASGYATSSWVRIERCGLCQQLLSGPHFKTWNSPTILYGSVRGEQCRHVTRIFQSDSPLCAEEISVVVSPHLKHTLVPTRGNAKRLFFLDMLWLHLRWQICGQKIHCVSDNNGDNK